MRRLALVVLVALSLPGSLAATPPPGGGVRGTVEPYAPEVAVGLIAPARVLAGDVFFAFASVTNVGRRTLSPVKLRLLVPPDVAGGAFRKTASLRPGANAAWAWGLCSIHAGRYVLVATASYTTRSGRAVSVDSRARLVEIAAARGAKCRLDDDR